MTEVFAIRRGPTARLTSRPPVFVIGAPRSGTSLLYKLLCLHPQTAWISNWNRRIPGVGPVSTINRMASLLPDRRMRVWFKEESNAYVYGNRRTLIERLFPMPVEGEPVYTRAGFPEGVTSAAEVQPASFDRLNRHFAGILRYAGGSVLVTKRISNNQRLPSLAEAFPGAHFVHLVRDGRAVALSLTKVDWWPDTIVGWYGGTPAEWATAGGHPLELAAHDWVAHMGDIEEGLDGIDPESIRNVCYEDFIQSPTEFLAEIAHWCGLGPADGWIDAVASLRYPNRNAAWESAFDRDTRDLVERIERPVLRRYGYDV